MTEKDIHLFINKNKKNILVKTDQEGNVTEIVSAVPEEELSFFFTNCRVVKKGLSNYLLTKDGELVKISYKPLNENTNTKTEEKTGVLGNIINSFGSTRKIKKRKMSPKQVVSNIFDAFSGPKKIIKEEKKEIHNIDNKNFNEIKAKADDLIRRIDELFDIANKDDKFKNDDEVVKYGYRYEGIKARYKYGLKMTDSPEMLNVRAKLVELYSRLTGRLRTLNGGVSVKPIELEKDVTPQETIVETTPDTVITKPKVEPAPVRPGSTVSNNLPPIASGKPAPVPVPAPEPTIEEKVSAYRSKYAETMAKYDELISLLNEKVKAAEDEVSYIDRKIEKIDEIISNAELYASELHLPVEQRSEKVRKMGNEFNLDTREINKYKSERERRLEERKAAEKKVQERKDEIRDVEDKKNEYIYGVIDADVPNEFAKEGYITMRKTRKEYIDLLNKRDELAERAKLLEEKKKLEAQLAAINEKLGQTNQSLNNLNEKLEEGYDGPKEISPEDHDTIVTFHKAF